MAARIPSSSHKLQALATFLRRHGAVSGGSWRSNPFGRRDPPPYKVGGVGLRLLSDSSKLRTTERNQSEEKRELPAPPKFGVSNWVKWLLGYVVTFLLPFWKNKWDNLLTLEGEAAKVVGEVEVVAEVVEKVATAADKALEEVVNQLPDNSKLKEAAQALEHVSSVAAKDAQLIENLINKASDVKQDIEELESIVEPIVDKIMHGKHTKS
ncbi:uncharacterized protein LOC130984923 isoform X1 [Salvia miltiorrhiza]|uniref:uncharacterized protein LOC130984923 isoform X1 n=1 Tax=Salvia miltiorrhiza TaxID=226208 RepID=UPI0025ACFDD3|nr:uncharacterized protein LOC130984923 isoform X1 [Salvia miltiorrhiza]